MRLETKGRKTGLPHIVELRFVFIQGSFFVIPGRGRSDWHLNALSSGSAQVRLGDFLFDTSARTADANETASALATFSKKYGGRLVEGWYRPSGACLILSPKGPAVRRGVAKGELSASTTIAEWAATKRNYYGDVAAAFDSASEEYDFTISHNFINTWIRRRSIAVLGRYIIPTDTLLEIGCGTGAEAVEISRYVSGIVATDISQSMVDLVTRKVRARRLSDKILPVKLGAAEISKVNDIVSPRAIRVAYSFNGALNCEPEIGRFVDGLRSVLDPQGYFVCSIRNTICVSEMLSHALALQFNRATPRKKQPIMVSVGGMDIPSTYYSPSQFVGFFRPHFDVKETIALPGLLPPAYLNEYYLRARMLASILEKAELALSGRPPLNRFGDQTLFVFQKSL